jgi:hypothetical protein
VIGRELRAEVAASPRVLIVGEDPGRGDPALPLYPLPEGCAGARLRELTGMGPIEYVHRTDRINLFRVAQRWSASAARERALDLAPLLAYRIVVALGRRVTAALLSQDEIGGPDPDLVPWYEPIVVGLPLARAPRCVVVPHPHPSGRSRVFNAPVSREAARIFWTRLLATDLAQVARTLASDQLSGAPSIVSLGPPAVDHELKTWPAYLDEVWHGRKTLDLRPDDRGFEAGQVLRLPTSTWGDRSVLVRVTNVLRDAPDLGLSPGFCALSIRVLQRESRPVPADMRGTTNEGAPVLDQVVTSRI